MAKEDPHFMGTKEAIRQMLTGRDFVPPRTMLIDLTAEQATAIPPGTPYSIATQVAHALFWQDRWLGRIAEQPLERKKGKNADWPVVSSEQWENVRDRFLDGLKQTKKLAEGDLTKPLWNDNTVDEVLLQIVVHNCYHLGQIALLRQLLGLWPVRGGFDAW
jgi:uncharacterized damage-inducible protein DinB